MPDYEVELKYRLELEAAEFLSRLSQVGAVRQGECEQVDVYFSHPVRDFGTTDEALRLRQVGDHNVLTYKGPLLDRLSKTRQEIEIAFAAGQSSADQMWALLRALGFRDVRRVRKHRQQHSLTWEQRHFTISIDHVEGLGRFIELETLTIEDDWQAARNDALRLADALSLSHQERRSYLELLLHENEGS